MRLYKLYILTFFLLKKIHKLPLKNYNTNCLILQYNIFNFYQIPTIYTNVLTLSLNKLTNHSKYKSINLFKKIIKRRNNNPKKLKNYYLYYNQFKHIYKFAQVSLLCLINMFNNFKLKTFFFYNMFLKYYFQKSNNLFYNFNYILLKFNYIFINYIKKITNILFSFKLCNTANFLTLKELEYSTTLLKKITPYKFKVIYKEEIAEIFLSTFITKNIIFLISWLKKNIENKPLKLFQAFSYYTYQIVKLLIWKFKATYNIEGFLFKYSGKFIKGGGKKKKISYKYGKLSSTTKSLKIIYKKFYIRTISGVIGCLVKISY